MSRTIRKDHVGRKYRDGQWKCLDGSYRRYKCRCERCTNRDREALREQIIEKEMVREIKRKS